MNRRKIGIAAVVVALVVLNLWRWLPDRDLPSSAMRAGAESTAFDPSQFTLRVTSLPTSDPRVRRNLFSTPEEPKVVKAPSVRKVTAEPAQPKKTEAELEAERIASEIAQIKLIAVVFQGKVGQAYITLRNESQMVRVGDGIGESFRVQSIDVDAIQLVNVAGGGEVRLTLDGT